MILKQRDTLNSNLNSKLTKLGYRRLDIDLEEVEQLEESVSKILKKANGTRREYLKFMQRQIQNLSNNCRGGTVPILWYCNNGLVGSYPIEIMNFQEENIDCMELIKLPKNSSAIRIQYDQLADIIAFEMICKDIGYTHKRIEEELHGTGIITNNSADKIKSLIGNNKPYEISRELSIKNSGYFSEEDGMIYDYFQYMSFSTPTYREPVEYSCRHALAFILNEMLDKLKEKDIPFTLCAVEDKSITFIVDKRKQKEFISIAEETVTIRAFGRLFNTSASCEVLSSTEEMGEQHG